MWSTPLATASRSTASAASRSFGGPNTPGPASCIAPYPTRFTVRAPSANAPALPMSIMSLLLWLIVNIHSSPGPDKSVYDSICSPHPVAIPLVAPIGAVAHCAAPPLQSRPNYDYPLSPPSNALDALHFPARG